MLLTSIIVGIVLGFISSRLLFLQGLTLLPWGITSLLIGYFSKSQRMALINGLTFGFFLGFVFILAGYTGSEPVITRIPFFVLIGIVSAICGALLSYVSQLIRIRLKKNS
jgi:hypothetical protein